MSQPANPAKPRCPICRQPKPLRKDGTLQQHNTVDGTRVCGGTWQEPEPVEEITGPDPREWAVLDGLLQGQAEGDDDA